jgi:outer membrane protein
MSDLQLAEAEQLAKALGMKIGLYRDLAVGVSEGSCDILASAKSSLSSVQAQADRSKKLVDAGSQAYGPYLEITAQLAREKVQVVNAENQLRANLLSLKQLLDLPGDNDFDIAVPSVNLDNLSFMGESVENIYTAALGLPQIKSAELSHTSSKIQLKLAQGRPFQDQGEG